MAVDKIFSTLVEETRTGTSRRVRVNIGEQIFRVPGCVVAACADLHKNFRFCERDTWDSLVAYLRLLSLWPPKRMHELSSTRDLDWVAVTEAPVLTSRLQRSIWNIGHCSLSLVQPAEYRSSVIQMLFGFNMDRNPSLEHTCRYLGKDLGYEEYWFVHLAVIAMFMLDSSVLYADGKPCFLTGDFVYDTGVVGQMSDFEY